jgi:hypothetical protein
MNKNSLRICAIILTYSTQQKQKPGCAGTSISVDASGNPADCGSINLVLAVPAKNVAGAISSYHKQSRWLSVIRSPGFWHKHCHFAQN